MYICRLYESYIRVMNAGIIVTFAYDCPGTLGIQARAVHKERMWALKIQALFESLTSTLETIQCILMFISCNNRGDR